MPSLNLFSGSVRVRDKRRPILWTGENAKHLTERYANDNERHPYLHVQAQQLLARSELFKAKNGGWLGLIERAKGTFCIPVLIHGQFVEIRSCYLMKSLIMDKAQKQKGISVATTSSEGFLQKSVEELQEYGGFGSQQETIDFVNRALIQTRRRKVQRTATRPAATQ